MSEPLARLGGYTPFGLPVPGVGPVIHLEHHGSCVIAVKWTGERSVPWWRAPDPQADWQRMAVH